MRWDDAGIVYSGKAGVYGFYGRTSSETVRFSAGKNSRKEVRMD